MAHVSKGASPHKCMLGSVPIPFLLVLSPDKNKTTTTWFPHGFPSQPKRYQKTHVVCMASRPNPDLVPSSKTAQPGFDSLSGGATVLSLETRISLEPRSPSGPPVWNLVMLHSSYSCSVTLEKREPFLGKTIFSGAATKKKEAPPIVSPLNIPHPNKTSFYGPKIEV